MLSAHELAGHLSRAAQNLGQRLDDSADETFALLPEFHQQLLTALNGFTLQQGAYRVFGVGRDDPLDLGRWNARATWRFAWDERVDAYLFIGATAWGDQYAFRRKPDGGLEPTVYFLEATLLRAEPMAESFDEFAETELLRLASRPYDPVTVAALDRFGPIDPADQWAFAPSIALGGEESLDNVVRLRAETAMTMAGDIASALHSSIPGSWPIGVQPWLDDHDRQRLRVEFDR